MIELAEGSLPWKQLSDPDDIAQKKRTTLFDEMCRNIPPSVKEFQSHIEKLQYHQLPNYSLLTSILQVISTLSGFFLISTNLLF